MGIKERKEREKNIRIEQIMDAAKKIFSVKGFRGTTMEDIAEEAELSPGSLYYYFKSKEDLYASLNIKILTLFSQKLAELYSDSELTTEQKIDSILDIFYDVFSEEPLIFLNVLSLQATKDLWNLSDDVLSEINSLASTAFKTLNKIFGDGIKEGLLIDCPPVVLSDIIYGSFSGIALWEESKKRSDPRKNHFRETMELSFRIFCKGIRK